MYQTIKSALLLVIWASVANAQATITGLSSQPFSLAINGEGSTSTIVRWGIDVTSSSPVTVTVESTEGETTTGTVLGGALSQTFNHPGTGTVTITF